MYVSSVHRSMRSKIWLNLFYEPIIYLFFRFLYTEILRDEEGPNYPYR